MLLEITGIIVFLLLIAPVKIRVDVFRGTGWQFDCWVRIWGLPLGWSLCIGGDGRPLLLSMNGSGQVKGNNIRSGLANIGAVLRTDGARRYFTRHVRILQLDARIDISMQNAAGTAVLTGFLQETARFVHLVSGHRARILVLPAFALERTEVQARCIVAFRLGHMIPVLIAALTAWVLERREHHLSNLPEEV